MINIGWYLIYEKCVYNSGKNCSYIHKKRSRDNPSESIDELEQRVYIKEGNKEVVIDIWKISKEDYEMTEYI